MSLALDLILWGVLLLAITGVGVAGFRFRRRALRVEPPKEPPLLLAFREDPEKRDRWEKKLEHIGNLEVDEMEVRVLDAAVRESPRDHEVLLNEMYFRGWDLVTAVPLVSHTPEVRYYFKRRNPEKKRSPWGQRSTSKRSEKIQVAETKDLTSSGNGGGGEE